MINNKCPDCGSKSWQNPDVPGENINDVQRICDDCGTIYFTDAVYIKPEDSGGSVSYYKVSVECPIHLEPYEAECGDLIAALNMNFVEANIFKELWRSAAARQGKVKRGHGPLRGAEKIKFFADRNLQLLRHEHGT